MIEAVLSSTQHPEYGEVSISFPILRKEYDHTIELLEGLDIGDALAQDCRVAGLDSQYPVLNRLEEPLSIFISALKSPSKRFRVFSSPTPETVVGSNPLPLSLTVILISFSPRSDES